MLDIFPNIWVKYMVKGVYLGSEMGKAEFSKGFFLSLFSNICRIWKSESEVAQSCSTLCDPMDLAYQASPSMGFSRQEYWSGLPFPSPGNLPNPGIEPGSPALQTEALPCEPPGKPGVLKTCVLSLANNFKSHFFNQLISTNSWILVFYFSLPKHIV